MGRGFRRHHSFQHPGAEPVAVLRKSSRHPVAHERRRGRAAGNNAHETADCGGADRREPVARQFFPGVQHHPHVHFCLGSAEFQALFQRQQDFADAEEADHRDQEIEAVEQLGMAECEAKRPGDRIGAHRRHCEPEHHRSDGLERRFLAHADECAEGKQVDREKLRRPEFERKFGYHRRKEGDHDHRHQRSDEGRRESGRERFARATLLREGIAVEGRRHRPRFTGNIEQNRSYCASEQGAPVDARQQDDRRSGATGTLRHRKSERQQNRHPVCAAKPRQYADDDAQDHAREHEDEVLQGQGDCEALHQGIQFLHVSSIPAPLPAALSAAES